MAAGAPGHVENTLRPPARRHGHAFRLALRWRCKFRHMLIPRHRGGGGGGRRMLKCMSLATIAPPWTVRVPATAQLLLPTDVCWESTGWVSAVGGPNQTGASAGMDVVTLISAASSGASKRQEEGELFLGAVIAQPT